MNQESRKGPVPFSFDIKYSTYVMVSEHITTMYYASNANPLHQSCTCPWYCHSEDRAKSRLVAQVDTTVGRPLGDAHYI